MALLFFCETIQVRGRTKIFQEGRERFDALRCTEARRTKEYNRKVRITTFHTHSPFTRQLNEFERVMLSTSTIPRELVLIQ